MWALSKQNIPLRIRIQNPNHDSLRIILLPQNTYKKNIVAKIKNNSTKDTKGQWRNRKKKKQCKWSYLHKPSARLYAFKLLLLCILVLICSFSLPNNYYSVKIRRSQKVFSVVPSNPHYRKPMTLHHKNSCHFIFRCNNSSFTFGWCKTDL